MLWNPRCSTELCQGLLKWEGRDGAAGQVSSPAPTPASTRAALLLSVLTIEDSPSKFISEKKFLQTAMVRFDARPAGTSSALALHGGAGAAFRPRAPLHRDSGPGPSHLLIHTHTHTHTHTHILSFGDFVAPTLRLGPRFHLGRGLVLSDGGS